MRRPMAKKVLAATMAAAMTMSVAACSKAPASTETPASTSKEPAVSTSTEPEKVEKYTPLKDKNGNVYDLGGIEVTIRDWWSGDGTVAAPNSAYEEAVQEWREWAQKTYNFTVVQKGISDWGSAPADFAEYAVTGDDNNYVFVLREAPALASAINSGLAYDLATLDCLNFDEAKFTRNNLHKSYTFGNSIYAMTSGYSEPRTGIFFNKRVLTEASIDPESIYKMVEDGTWTWDAFEQLCAKVHRDTDADGIVDIYALTINESDMTNAAVFSNGGRYVDKDASGKFVYCLEDAATLEALEWCVRMYNAYDNHDPEGANWDYYKEEFMSGKVAFMPEGTYCGYPNGYLMDMEDELGFVVFPKGPAPTGKITNIYSDNLIMIPSCYDADKAWKCAFAWNMWTEAPAGYEDVNGFIDNCRNGLFDENAIKNVEMMMTQEHSDLNYAGQVPDLDLGPDLTWGIAPNADVSAKVAEVRDKWTAYIDKANNK